MVYYNIIDVLSFLEESRYNRYEPIEEVIEALNNFNLNESERMQHARALLRLYGLREQFKIDGSQEKEVQWELPIFKGAIISTQLFDITFTNGKINFWQNLN